MSATPTIPDRSAHPSTGHHARQLLVGLTLDARRGVRWIRQDWRRAAILTTTAAYALASVRWPVATTLVVIGGGVAWWQWRGREWLRLVWMLRGHHKYDAFAYGVFTSAGVHPPPTIRRKKGTHRPDVRKTERSWTFELHAPQAIGKHSAHDLCKLWPQLKNEIGEGCIAVRLHERTGNHLTMVVIWRREAGERVVRISRDLEIIVHPHQPYAHFVQNPGLDGWVRPEYAHVGEHHTAKDDLFAPTLDPRDDHFVDTDEPVDDEAGEPEADDEGETDPDPEPSYEPRPPATIWAVPDPLLRPVADCYPAGGGEGDQTTPPPPEPEEAAVWAAPVGRPVSAGLFAPRPAPDGYRPAGAAPGTATGDLWDLVRAGHPRTTRDLAELAGLTVGSAGNALSRWRDLGLVAHDSGLWLVRLRPIATVVNDGSEESPADRA